MCDDLDLFERRFNRERSARKEAEDLLEQKSREVFDANQQLRDLAERTKAIVETAAEGIVTYDQSGVVQSFNRSAQRIFRRENAVGFNVRELFEAGVTTEDALFKSVPDLTSELNEYGEPVIPEPIQLIGVRSNGQSFVSEVACQPYPSCRFHNLHGVD